MCNNNNNNTYSNFLFLRYEAGKFIFSCKFMQFFAYMGKIKPKISGAITGDAFCENFTFIFQAVRLVGH